MIGQRIRELRKKLDMSQEELAEKAGAHSNTIARWERGEIEPRKSSVAKLAAALNTTVEYLMGRTDFPDEEGINAQPADVIWVPVVSNNVKVCCGEGNGYPDDIIWEEEGRYPIPTTELMGSLWRVGDRGYHIISVEGDSMEPKIHDGDRILIEDVEITNGDIAVCLYRGKVLLRGVTFEKDGVCLHAWNKDYRDITVTNDKLEDLYFLGKLVGVIPPIQRISSMW